MADQIGAAIVFFSGGKDSCVMTDMMATRMEIILVYKYFINGLSFKEKIFEVYKKRYNIKMVQIPSTDLFIEKGINVKEKEVEELAREKTGMYYVSYGMRKDESIFRRGMMKNIDNGIDIKNGRLYPLAEWSANDIMRYIKQKKLPISIEYQYGLRDINIPKADAMEFIKQKFPDDYIRIKEQLPRFGVYDVKV